MSDGVAVCQNCGRREEFDAEEQQEEHVEGEPPVCHTCGHQEWEIE